MSKALNAFTAGMARAQKEGDAMAAPPSGSGNWSKMALESMETRLREATESHDLLSKTLYEGILAGTVPIAVSPDQITDQLGTDRVIAEDGDEGDTESYAALVANIKERGQRVPIRIRHADPAWRPDPRNPRDVSGQSFILQSGRRRLAACRDLGLTPIAFLSFPGSEHKLEDLQERFFENVVRRNLTPIEKFYSIGLIASEMPSVSQGQIAEILGVSQSYVSRGAAIARYFDRLSKDLDLAAATVEQVDERLKAYRDEAKSQEDSAVKARQRRKEGRGAAQDGPFRTLTVGDVKMSLKRRKNGPRLLSLESETMSDELITAIVDLVKSRTEG